MPQEAVCPYCKSPLEKGSVAAESLTGGAKWHKARSVLALGGESIGDYTIGGMVWLDGARCSKCRLLLLNY
jgi:hypothetical protein